MLHVAFYYDDATPYTAIRFNDRPISPHSKLRKFQNMHLEEWAEELFQILYWESNEEEMQIGFHGSQHSFEVMQKEAERFAHATGVKIVLQRIEERPKSAIITTEQKREDLLKETRVKLSAFSFLKEDQAGYEQLNALSEKLQQSVSDLENRHKGRYLEVLALISELQDYQWSVREQPVYEKGLGKWAKTILELNSLDETERMMKKMEACQYDIFSDFAMLCDIHLKQEAEALRKRAEELIGRKLSIRKLGAVFEVKRMAWSVQAEQELMERMKNAVRAIREWKGQTLQDWIACCRGSIRELEREREQAEEGRAALEILREFQQQWIELGRSR